MPIGVLRNETPPRLASQSEHCEGQRRGSAMYHLAFPLSPFPFLHATSSQEFVFLRPRCEDRVLLPCRDDARCAIRSSFLPRGRICTAAGVGIACPPLRPCGPPGNVGSAGALRSPSACQAKSHRPRLRGHAARLLVSTYPWFPPPASDAVTLGVTFRLRSGQVLLLRALSRLLCDAVCAAFAVASTGPVSGLIRTSAGGVPSGPVRRHFLGQRRKWPSSGGLSPSASARAAART
ncbi:hypothetical protein TRVL_06644 [Trypanosoma vivax]|nr:hypothetical protein TRVL_06644 [Trypanosoma vivax]